MALAHEVRRKKCSRLDRLCYIQLSRIVFGKERRDISSFPPCFESDSGRSCNDRMRLLVNPELRCWWKEESMCEEEKNFIRPPRMLSGVEVILRQTGLLNPCQGSQTRRITRRDDWSVRTKISTQKQKAGMNADTIMKSVLFIAQNSPHSVHIYKKRSSDQNIYKSKPFKIPFFFHLWIISKPNDHIMWRAHPKPA